MNRKGWGFTATHLTIMFVAAMVLAWITLGRGRIVSRGVV
jgi:hypothetical protein